MDVAHPLLNYSGNYSNSSESGSFSKLQDTLDHVTTCNQKKKILMMLVIILEGC